jgi:sortase A
MIIRSASRALEIVCWALGAALIMLYCSARAFAAFEQQEGIANFTQARLSADAVLASERPFADRTPDQSRWSQARRKRYAAHLGESQESGAIPAAVLRIRSVQLEVPVYADSSERNLNRGAVLVSGTAAPESDGNVAIAAHRDGFFRALKDVAIGDIVEVESLLRRRQYRVTELSIVAPTDTSPVRSTQHPVLTLVTCYPFYFVGSAPQRYIVRAVAVS